MLAAMAQATSRIRIGCQVTGMIYRHPAVLANMAATVDIISDGRLELGLGAGWNEEETTAYGIPLPPLKERFDRFDEGLEAIVGLLTQETTTLDGSLRAAHRRALRAQAGAAAPSADHDRRDRSDPHAARGRTVGAAVELPQRFAGGLAGEEGDPPAAVRRDRPRLGRDHLLGQPPLRRGRRPCRACRQARRTATSASTSSSSAPPRRTTRGRRAARERAGPARGPRQASVPGRRSRTIPGSTDGQSAGPRRISRSRGRRHGTVTCPGRRRGASARRRRSR